jgi:acyl carrier protein
MKKTEFVNKLSEACGFENTDLTPETRLDSIDEYDSMAMLSIIAFVHKKFGINLSANQLQNLVDFNSIIKIIGEEKFV